MFDIRSNGKQYHRLKKLYEKRFNTGTTTITFQFDDAIREPVIMTQTLKGEFAEWMRGYDNVRNFLKHGYNRIVKKCPYSVMGLFSCKAEKCQLYYTRNLTGDCSHRWNAILQGKHT